MYVDAPNRLRYMKTSLIKFTGKSTYNNNPEKPV